MSHCNSSKNTSGARAVAKQIDQDDTDRSVNERARFGIRLIRRANLPAYLLSPSSKKKHNIASVIADAIQISTSDDHEEDDCCRKLEDENPSVRTIDTTPVDKTVNFDLLQTEEFDASYDLDDETIADGWYSDDERMSMKFNRDNALAFGEDNQEWIDSMNSLIHYCNYAIPQSTYDPEELKEKAKDLPAKYRGLEVQGLPQLSAMRRKHTNSVLMHVARIPKKMPEDLRDRMVSARSLQYSRPLALLALILAQADAEEARRSE